MPKLTDDELGDLLRETFADQENLVDHLPKATKRRPLVPVLLAAAAVLAVLGRHVQTVAAIRPASRRATATPADAADVWATAMPRDRRSHEPAGGWRKLQIGPAGRWQASKTTQADPGETGRWHATAPQAG